MTEEWTTTTLGEFCQITMGQSPVAALVNRERRGLPLLNGPTEFGESHPTPVQWAAMWTKEARPGDLLFCVRGSTTGRMNWADQAYAIGRGIASIRGRSAADTRLAKAVIDLRLVGLLQQATGSTFPNLSRPQLARIQFRCPPAMERERIAAVVRAFDDHIEMNRSLVQGLDALFQTRWALEYAKHANQPMRALAEIARTQYGLTASASHDAGGPKFLRVTDINKQNWINWETVPTVPSGVAEGGKYRLKRGDLLVARMADPGKSAIYEGGPAAVFASYLVRLKPDSLADGLYIYGFLKSPEYAAYLRLSRGFGCGAARERESACPVRKTLACDSRSFQQERHFQGEE